jgi:hypothetical protein
MALPPGNARGLSYGGPSILASIDWRVVARVKETRASRGFFFGSSQKRTEDHKTMEWCRLKSRTQSSGFGAKIPALSVFIYPPSNARGVPYCVSRPVEGSPMRANPVCLTGEDFPVALKYN